MNKQIKLWLMIALLVTQLLNPIVSQAITLTADTQNDSSTTDTNSQPVTEPLIETLTTSEPPAIAKTEPTTNTPEKQPTTTPQTSQTDLPNDTSSNQSTATDETPKIPRALTAGATFTQDGLPYQVLTAATAETNGTVQVGSGSRITPPANDLLTIPETVTDEDSSYTVTHIAPNAFSFLTATQLSLPETLLSIGSRAFSCTKLKAIHLPTSVYELGDGAFSGNEALERLTLSAAIKHLPSNLLTSSSAIKRVDIPEGIESVGVNAFRSLDSLRTVTLPASLKSVAEESFSRNDSLVNVTFAENSQLTTIGPKAFHFSGNLKTITLPSSLQHIGADAFRYVEKLESIGDLSVSNLQSIGSGAFYSTSLRTIALPSTLNEMGSGIFNNVETLESIEMAADNPNFMSQEGVLYDKQQTTIITYPILKRDNEYTVPSTVTAIDAYTFEKNNYLTTVNLPEGLLSIGEFAFRYAQGISKLTIPASVSSIGRLALADMDSLTTLTILGPVETIGRYAIYNNSALEAITLAEGVKKIETNGISRNSQLTSLTIKAPSIELVTSSFGSLSDYSELTITVINETVKNQLITIGFAAEQITIKDVPVQVIGTVLVTYLDLNDEPLAEPLSLTGEVGTAYETTAKEIDDFQLIAPPQNATGVYTEDQQTVIYRYEKIPEITLGTVFTNQGIVYKILNLPTNTEPGLVQVGDGLTNASADLAVVSLPSSLTYQDQIYLVSEIGERAFYENEALTSLDLSEGLITLNSFSLFANPNLREVTLPDSVTTLKHFAISANNSLEKVTISPTSRLQELQNNALADNDLQEIYLPSALTRLGHSALAFNFNLTSVTFATGFSLAELPYRTFFRTNLQKINLPPSITAIGEEAFYHNQQLKAINLANVAEIGNQAFAYTGLTTVTLADSLTSLENGTFYHNDHLQTVTLGQNLTTLGLFGTADPEEDLLGVFENNQLLTSISLPASLTEIGRNVFKNSPSLKEIQLHMTELTRLGSNAFYEIHEDALFYVKTQQVKDRLLEEDIKPENIIFFDGTLPREKGSVTVTYRDQTGAEIAESLIISGELGDSYQTEAKLIEHYTLLKDSNNTTGTFTTEPVTVTYTYRKDTLIPLPKTGLVIVQYLTTTGDQLAEDHELSGNVGESYQTSALAFTDYTLVAEPANASGTFVEESTTVTYLYQPNTSLPPVETQGHVNISYVTTDKQELAPKDQLTGNIGEPYQTQAKRFREYRLTETPQNAAGTFGDEPINVIYVYEKEPVDATTSTVTTGAKPTASSPTKGGKNSQHLPKAGEVLSSMNQLVLWLMIVKIALLYRLKKRVYLQ